MAIIWLVLGTTLVVGVLYISFYRDDLNKMLAPAKESIDLTQGKKEEGVDKEDADTEMSTSAKEETAVLVAIDPYSGSGSATRVFANGTFTHQVVAEIDDPAKGKFFEGWLVIPTTPPQFFSTGKLTKNDSGQYILNFTASVDYSEYIRVVITEETEANGLDGVPEDHVLEGDF